ncbi:MAG: hypothetical protein ABI680_03475 [Chthoniobacteraceae bacterium]
MRFLPITTCFIYLAGGVIAQDASKAKTNPRKPRLVKMAMRDGLRFDPPRFSAQPGEEIILQIENLDSTQQSHNFLLVQPGKRDDVVKEALELGEKGPAQDFVPKDPAIIIHSQLLEADKNGTIRFRVPHKKAIYPYVCTFPGHGMVMYGAIYAGIPEPPLAEDPNIPPTAVQSMIAGNGRRPFIQRVFMPEAGPAAIAVALPGQQNFCWDAGECRLRYAWKGSLVDASAHWSGNGRDLAKLPTAPWWSAGRDEFPFRFGAANAPVPAVKFLGYRVENGLPEFHYRAGEQEVFESITETEDGLGIIIQRRLPGLGKTLYCLRHSDDSAEWQSSIGTWKNGALEVSPEQAANVTMTLKPGSAAQP